MGNSAFGYKNVFPRGQLASGSEESSMAVSRLGGKLGSFSTGWQTKLGVTRARLGSWFTVDALTEQSWRVFLLTRTNLSSGAQIRWRVGGPGLLVPMTPIVDIDLAADPFVAPSVGTWSFTRSTPAWRCKADGTWEEVAAGVPAIHYDPWTLKKRGMLVQPATTNRVRNPRGEGLVYPSTPPTNWSSVVGANLTLEWLQQATVDGLPGAYVHIFGTTAGSVETAKIYFETTTGVAATQDQRCPNSLFHQLTGSTTGITYSQGYDELTNTGTLLLERDVAQASMIPALGWNTGRAGQGRRIISIVNTNPSATLTNIRPYFKLTVAASTTIDIVLFLAGATQEQNITGPGTMTPIYPPVSAPAQQARSSDVPGYIPPAGAFSALHLGGSAYVEWTPLTTFNNSQSGGSPLQLDNGTNNERLLLRGGTVSSTRGRFSHAVVTGNVTVFEGNTVGGNNAATSMTLDLAHSDNPYKSAEFWDGTGTTGAANWNGYGTASLLSNNWVGAMPTGFTRVQAINSPQCHFTVSRWKIYGEKLSQERILNLILEGVPLDPTEVAYDSGWLNASVAPSIGQTVHLPTSIPRARYLRCDIEDPTNPDGFINVPLAYAGALWEPTHGIDWPSTLETQVGEQVLEARGGQEYVEPLYRQRVKNLVLSALKDDEVWAYQQELDRVAATGENVLLLPDRTSPYLNMEAIFGVLKSQSPLGYAAKSTRYRNWRARLSERL